MTGYQTNSSNPQMLIGGIAIAWCILVGGFLLPSFYLFRKTKIIISIFAVIWIIFIILVASTSIGFPYKPKTAVQRIYVQVSRNFALFFVKLHLMNYFIAY